MFVLVACVHVAVGESCDLTDDDKDVALQTGTVRWQGLQSHSWIDVVKQMVGHWFSHYGVPRCRCRCCL